MMMLLVAAVLAPNISEFFPLNPGDTWEYVAEGQGGTIRLTNRVQPAKEVGDVPAAFPVDTIVQGRTTGTTYYMVKDNSVYVVAFDIKKPLFEPRQMLTLEEKTAKWDYQFTEDYLPVDVKNEATLRGRRKVLDREVDVLELKVDAVLGDPKGANERMTQVFLYGRGIGLIEMTEERKVAKNTFKRKMRLAKYTPAVAGGSDGG
jgi:hypothetical protein